MKKHKGAAGVWEEEKNRWVHELARLFPLPLVMLQREKVVFMSDDAKRLLGMSEGHSPGPAEPGSLCSKPDVQPAAAMFFSFFFEDAAAYTHFRSSFLERLDSRVGMTTVMPLRRMDGEFFLCRFTGKAVDGLGADVSLTLEDITCKEEETASIRSDIIHVSEELQFFKTIYKRLFETVNAGMVLMKPDGVIIDANDYVKERFGSGWNGRRCCEMCEGLWSNSEHGTCTFCRKDEVMASGRPAHEMVTDFKGNHWIFTWAPIHNNRGRVSAVIKVMVNITPEVHLKERVAHREEILASIVETIPAGIMIFDSAGDIIYANKAFINGFCFKTPVHVGRNITEFENGENEAFLEKLRHAMEVGAVIRGVTCEHSENKSADNCSKTFDFYPVYLSEGRRLGMLVEINRRQEFAHCLEVDQKVRTLDRGIRITSRMMEEQEKLAAVGRLAAGITHELNTPTTYVRGNLQVFDKYAVQLENELGKLLKTGRGGAGSEEQLQRIGSLLETMRNTGRSAFLGTERIMNIISSMRGFVRKDTAGNEKLNLYEPLRDTLVLTYNRIKRYGTITVNDWNFIPEESGSFIASNVIHVYGNSQRLCQLFVILTNNSIDAWQAFGKRQGNVKERLHLEITVRLNGNSVNVTFCDNAGGMPPEIEDKVFEPFFTTREAGRGTGLGLNIALQIIREHGGEFILENEFGKGACWHISLPRKEKH